MGVAREVGMPNACFRRSRMHAGSMKIMENGRNMTHMALLELKLSQNECQRRCEFSGHPPDPYYLIKKSKWPISGHPMKGQKNV